MEQEARIIYLVAVAFIGAAFGSFISLISYRFPRDLPVVAARSRCPSCNIALGIRDLFPIFSYLLQGGKCRHCDKKIAARYVLIEIITAAAFVAIYLAYEATPVAFILALFVVSLIALIVTDLEHYIIPDQLQVALIALALAYGFVTERRLEELIGGAVVGLIIGLSLHYGSLWLLRKDGLGLGDVKFLFVVGLWLGIKPLVPFLFFSGVLGIVTALIWRALGQGERFPFGPALAVALLLCVVVPALPEAFWQSEKWLLPLQ